jgi:hypothetical protein
MCHPLISADGFNIIDVQETSTKWMPISAVAFCRGRTGSDDLYFHGTVDYPAKIVRRCRHPKTINFRMLYPNISPKVKIKYQMFKNL